MMVGFVEHLLKCVTNVLLHNIMVFIYFCVPLADSNRYIEKLRYLLQYE